MPPLAFPSRVCGFAPGSRRVAAGGWHRDHHGTQLERLTSFSPWGLKRVGRDPNWPAPHLPKEEKNGEENHAAKTRRGPAAALALPTAGWLLLPATQPPISPTP